MSLVLGPFHHSSPIQSTMCSEFFLPQYFDRSQGSLKTQESLKIQNTQTPEVLKKNILKSRVVKNLGAFKIHGSLNIKGNAKAHESLKIQKF